MYLGSEALIWTCLSNLDISWLLLYCFFGLNSREFLIRFYPEMVAGLATCESPRLPSYSLGKWSESSPSQTASSFWTCGSRLEPWHPQDGLWFLPLERQHYCRFCSSIMSPRCPCTQGRGGEDLGFFSEDRAQVTKKGGAGSPCPGDNCRRETNGRRDSGLKCRNNYAVLFSFSLCDRFWLFRR